MKILSIFKKQKPYSQNYLDFIPAKCEDFPWKTDENGMAVIDAKNKGFFNFIAQRFFNRPKVSHISLDKYGTAVWKNINGSHTVYSIAKIMEQDFPDEKEDMLKRTVAFMAVLQRQRFVRM